MEKQFPAHNAGRFSPSISILNLAALFKSKKRISPRFFQFCATARFPRAGRLEIGYFFNGVRLLQTETRPETGENPTEPGRGGAPCGGCPALVRQLCRRTEKAAGARARRL
jgi:hypothetical protein